MEWNTCHYMSNEPQKIRKYEMSNYIPGCMMYGTSLLYQMRLKTLFLSHDKHVT